MSTLALACWLPAAAQSSNFHYTVSTWSAGNLVSSQGYALNDVGNVAGRVILSGAAAPTYAFVTAGRDFSIYALPPANASSARGINNSGRWVGSALDANSGDSVGLYDTGGAVSAVNALGGSFTRFAGINDAGTAVGRARLPGPAGQMRGFIYDGQGVQELPTLGGTESQASAVNGLGQVVGSSSNALGQTQAFIYQGNSMTALAGLGGDNSVALALNNRGDVAGSANLVAFGPNQAVVWRQGQMSTLGSLGGSFAQASAINDAGLAVGFGLNNDSLARAFVAGAVGMHDLNDHLATRPTGDEILTDAVGINIHGQILANTQGERAVLLTPGGTLRWAGLAGGSFSDGARWDSGVGQGPSRFLDMVLASPASQTVQIAQSAQVRSLSVGTAGSSGGSVNVAFKDGSVLFAQSGVVLERSAILSGDGTLSGNTLLRGTVQVNGCCLRLDAGSAPYDLVAAQGGLVTGNGQLNARLQLQSGAELRVGAGQHLRLVGAQHQSEGVAEVRGGEWEVSGAWVNQGSGTVRLDGATVRFQDGLINNAQVQIGFGGASVFGRVHNDTGATVVASGGNQTTFWDAVRNDGELRASAGSRIVYFGAVNGAGSFTTNGTGAYHRFEGGYSPGNSPADVQLGDTELASVLTMELAGTTPGSQHDRISFVGSLQIDISASLQVLLLDGFAPQLGDSFDLFEFDQVPVGGFGSLHLPALTDGLRWDTSALYTAGDLRVTAVPEPAALWLMAGGVLVLLLRRRGTRLP